MGLEATAGISNGFVTGGVLFSSFVLHSSIVFVDPARSQLAIISLSCGDCLLASGSDRSVGRFKMRR